MMKTPTKFIALLSGAALLASSAFAQGVATNPVGYITLDIAGTGGVGSSAVSVLGAPLQNAVDVAGALTGVSGTTLTSSTAAFGSYAGAHYIQITSGSNVGVITTVLSSTATTLTTADDISTLITGDENFEIRAYTTLADVFGAANEAGIGSGASSALADELLVYNGEGFDIYYYQEGHAFATDGWRLSTNAFGDASATPIPVGVTLIAKRKANDPLQVVVSGSVLATDSVIPVENGVNWISGASPISYTLASYFGATGGDLQTGASSTLADEVLVPNGEGFDIYYYQEGHAFATDGWRLSSNAFGDASATEIASAGTGFVLKRKGAAYNQIDESPLN
jgi:uncharacterized protein (TIGR02597 family)